MHGGAGDSFQFSAQYKLTAILRRNPHLTSQGQWVRKMRKVLVPKRKSLVLTWAPQRKQTASCSGHRRRRRGCLFLNFEFGDPNPVALQRTVWWFLYNTSVSELENISQAIRYCALSANTNKKTATDMNTFQAAQDIDEDEEDVPFLYNTSVSQHENISQAIRYCLPPLQFLQVQTKHRIHRQLHIPNISW